MPPTTLITPTLTEAAIAGHAAGKTMEEIGRSLGVSGSLISKALRQQGITSRIAPDVPERVLVAIAAGQPVRAVAKRFGIGSGSVNRIMRRAGIEPRGAGPQKILPDGTEDRVVADYTAGGSAEEIASCLGVGVQTVYRTLARRGVETREHHTIVTDEIRDAVHEAATTGGQTSVEIGAAVGVAKTTVQRILGPGVLPMGRPRECELDEGAFDVLTPEAAYWIGFLMADGAVGEDHIVAVAAERDRGHIENFRSFLKSTHAVSVRQPGPDSFGGPSVSLKIRSRRLAAAVISRGMVSVKADREPISELAGSRDYWRGVVDGDGSIGTIDRRRIYATITLCGQPRLVAAFQHFLATRFSVFLRQTPVSTIVRVSTAGSKALAIIRALYDNASIALDRKAARARALLDGDQTTLFAAYGR